MEGAAPGKRRCSTSRHAERGANEDLRTYQVLRASDVTVQIEIWSIFACIFDLERISHGPMVVGDVAAAAKEQLAKIEGLNEGFASKPRGTLAHTTLPTR